MSAVEWSPFDAALRGALLATLVLLEVALARVRPTHAAARVGTVLMAGLVVQVVGASPVVEHGWPIAWQAPLVGVSIGNALLFWLFARALFEDDFRSSVRHAVGWAAVAAVGASFCVSVALFGPHALPTAVLRFALRWLPAVFAALVVFAAASQWRADLVEPRRRLRGFIVLAGAAYAVAMVAVRLATTHGTLSATAAGFDTGALLLIVLVTATAVLRVSDFELLPRAAGAGAPPVRAASADAHPLAGALAGSSAGSTSAEPFEDPADAAEEHLATALERLMREQHVYRVDDLTVGLLALKLGVPEYRLRRCINRRLGHRNFNAYVNALRLAEAREALADPARRATSVLEIAMAAGFASIGPFNRAFKAEGGLTPSEFRRRALADS
jgi:AraC-like DNA-binding protein